MEIGNVTFNKELINKLVKEYGDEPIMCESCNDAVAHLRGHGAELCTDCFHEIYDGCP